MTSSVQPPRKVFLGITGASGALYGVRTLQMLVEAGMEVSLCVSDPARRVLWEECDIRFEADPAPLLAPGQDASRVCVHSNLDIGAPPASGTALGDLALVVPCSLSTLGRIAGGCAERLIERAAHVALKEGRPLVLVPRETPLSRIHLEGMSRLAWAGATILPASPGFYHRPRTVLELVDHVGAKILEVCRIPQTRIPPWTGGKEK